MSVAKNKIGLQFTGWKEVMQNIGRMADESGLKQATESALKATKDHINAKADAIMQKGNMPAGGKYWTGETKRSLDKNYDVEWSGYTGSINIGYDLDASGLTSIYLMHGTPKMAPVSGLYDAFYGKKTKSETKVLQKEAIEKWIERNL